jgi:hypothetical protein
MPRNWLTLPKLPGLEKPVLHVQGPRKKTIAVAEVLPYLGPMASLPAKHLAKELMRRGYEIQAEVPMAGGTSTAGGMVVDIQIPAMKLVIRVQGEYWHTRAGIQSRDDAEALYLKGKGLRVVDVWVWDIDHRLDWVLTYQIGIRL